MCDQDPKSTPLQRRQLLASLGVLGLSMLAGCGQQAFTSDTSGAASAGADSTSGVTNGGTCAAIASETNGPFPADGTNTAGDGNEAKLDLVYTGSPILRGNIRESFPGVPLTLNLSLQNVSQSCAALRNYYVYVWHCTAAGIYSAYSGSMNSGTHTRSETYLRGIQQTNSAGEASFTTIYPGWYSGRAQHIHAEIYSSLDAVNPIKITQFAFPMSINRAVAAQTSYGYKGVSGMLDNSADNVFSDGTSTEMLTLTSDSSTGGYIASIAVKVAA